MLVSVEAYELFNPFHDKLGRFATKQGAATVSGGVKSWLDKPVATVKGKTITRKHAIVAIGAVAAAALAAGAIVATRGKRRPILGKKIGVMWGQPGPDDEIDWWSPSIEDVPSTWQTEKARQLGRMYDKVVTHLGRLDPSFKKDELREITIAPNADVWRRIWGSDEGPAGFVSSGGRVFVGPSTLYDKADEQAGVLIHELLHTRERPNIFLGAGKVVKGNQTYEAAEWLEEGLTESLTHILSPMRGRYDYQYSVIPIQHAIRKLCKGNAAAGFHITNFMHKNNSTFRNLNFYMKSEVPGILIENGIPPRQSEIDEFMEVFFNRVPQQLKKFDYIPDPNDVINFQRNSRDFSGANWWEESAEFADWMEKMREYAFQKVLKFSDTPVSMITPRLSIEESERRVIERYGTIYVPDGEILKNLKEAEREEKAGPKEENA